MNFDFSDEQYLFRDSVRGYLAERLPTPAAAEALTEQALEALWADLADLGVFAVLVPEAHGGLGLGLVDLVLALQEFGRRLVPISVVDTLITTDVLVRCASAEQQQRLLPPIAAGRLRIAVAAAEVGGSGDARRMRTGVAATAHGAQLSGTKILVPAAARADQLLVACGDGALALVEPGRRGLALRQQSTIDLGSDYFAAQFDAVALSGADRLGDPQTGAGVTRLQDTAAMAAAAMMTGISRMVLERVVEYVKQRVQFGRPLGSFQAIKHRCADLAVAIDSADAAAYYAAWTLATDSSDQAKAVSIAKSYGGDTARAVCNEGIQLHGGMGFTWDLGLHGYLRRVKVLEQMAGDATSHRRRVLSAVLLELGIKR